MPLSHNHKCLFVHIPRTGGTSFRRMLKIDEEVEGLEYLNTKGLMPVQNQRWYCYSSYPSIKRIHLPSHTVPRVLHKEHLCIKYMSQLSLIDQDIFDNYYKFAFVRNPWDRFISLWVKFKEEVLLQEQFNGLFNLHIDYDFKEPQELLKFLLLAHRKDLLLPRWFKPQYEYVHDENLRVLTNYVGMYEKFQFSFDFLCDRIDVPHKTLPWSSEDHRRKKKDGKHYTEWYDDIMISAVAEIYYNDIRTWGYEFGD